MSLNIGLIRESFEAIKPHADDVASRFYDELFTRYPASKGLFKESRMASQKKALVNGLAHIVEFLDNSEHLTDYLRKMGGRHVAYGTEPEHFKWVGESFLATLAYFFDEQWTDELATSWITAFGVIAAEMKIGMDQEKNKVTELRSVESTQAVTPAAAAPPADLGTVARNLADDLLKRTVDSLVASPEFQSLVKQRAMEALHQAVELEAKQMIEVYKTNVA